VCTKFVLHMLKLICVRNSCSVFLGLYAADAHFLHQDRNCQELAAFHPWRPAPSLSLAKELYKANASVTSQPAGLNSINGRMLPRMQDGKSLLTFRIGNCRHTTRTQNRCCIKNPKESSQNCVCAAKKLQAHSNKNSSTAHSAGYSLATSMKCCG